MTEIHDFNNLPLSDRNGMYSGNHEVNEAVRRVTPVIDVHMEAIKDFVMSIPESSDGHVIISAARKEVYVKELELRFGKLILPHYGTAIV